MCSVYFSYSHNQLLEIQFKRKQNIIQILFKHMWNNFIYILGFYRSNMLLYCRLLRPFFFSKRSIRICKPTTEQSNRCFALSNIFTYCAWKRSKVEKLIPSFITYIFSRQVKYSVLFCFFETHRSTFLFFPVLFNSYF